MIFYTEHRRLAECSLSGGLISEVMEWRRDGTICPTTVVRPRADPCVSSAMNITILLTQRSSISGSSRWWRLGRMKCLNDEASATWRGVMRSSVSSADLHLPAKEMSALTYTASNILTALTANSSISAFILVAALTVEQALSCRLHYKVCISQLTRLAYYSTDFISTFAKNVRFSESLKQNTYISHFMTEFVNYRHTAFRI